MLPPHRNPRQATLGSGRLRSTASRASVSPECKEDPTPIPEQKAVRKQKMVLKAALPTLRKRVHAMVRPQRDASTTQS